MPRRRALTEAQLETLFALPTVEADLIRHWTLDGADLAAVGRRRGPSNQLGYALQLCAFRYPGRLLRPGEAIPDAALRFVVEQVHVGADALAADAARRLYAFGPVSTWPALVPFIAGKPDDKLIAAQWDDVLRMTASVRTGTVSASLLWRDPYPGREREEPGKPRRRSYLADVCAERLTKCRALAGFIFHRRPDPIPNRDQVRCLPGCKLSWRPLCSDTPSYHPRRSAGEVASKSAPALTTRTNSAKS